MLRIMRVRPMINEFKKTKTGNLNCQDAVASL